MKRFLILSVLLLVALGLSAQVKIGGLTDAYAIAGVEGGTLNVGQDVNLDMGPVFLDLTADWTKTLYGGADVLALTYAVGFSKAFGIFTPSIKLTGDRSFAFQTKAWTGDFFSDLEPSLDIVLGKFGINAYADLSFEKGYDLLQTVDTSAFFKAGTLELRAGLLYMDAQAVTDDVGYPNAPAAREGVSFYAKASVSY